VQVRPIRPTDGEALVDFHEHLSQETTRLRFFSIHPHLSDEEVRRFCTVDHHDREALVVEEDGAIHGIGRYDVLPGTTDAEVAFVVRDDHQGEGIGSLLFRELAARARAEGIARFVAETLYENTRMQAVFKHAGLHRQSTWGDGVVHIVLDLGPVPAPA
jgi:GNAT superfamily N-acetyltransferase